MKFKPFFAFLFLLVCTVGFAYDADFPKVKNVIQFSDLDEGSLSAIFNGESSDIVLELQEGASIPVKFVFKFGFFSVEDFPNFNLRVHKHCFIRLTEEEWYVSFDGKTWEDLEEMTDLCCTKTQAKFDRASQKLVIEVEQVECDCWDDDDDDDWD